ncbi:hypothetical protein Vi05172_g10427 [Venturia inaequalis]|nr:hypothetical protein Vi05172_g10427 [Venturia inaequalis]
MAQSWLPRDLILESDLVERLFAWHGTLPEHHEACRNDFFKADRKDLQYLLQPLVNALPGVSGRGGKTLQAKAERALLVSADLDLMWEAFGAQMRVERKDFKQCIETAPQDVFIGLIQYYAKLGDMSPLNFRAMNIEAGRQAWAGDSWETIDDGLAGFLANVKKGRKQIKAVANKEATLPTKKAPAVLKKNPRSESPFSASSPDIEMPSSPPIRTTAPRTIRAPTFPMPQTEDKRIADEAFARAMGQTAAAKRKCVTSTNGTPNNSRTGIEDEAFARAMGHTNAMKSKPPPSTKGTQVITQKSFRDEAFARASGNTTAAKNKPVQSTAGTPSVVPKSFADEAFARAMDSAAAKRKRAPSQEGTPDTATKDMHKIKRQRLTKDVNAKSSRKSLVVSPPVETKLSSPVPVPSIETQKTPQNRQKLLQQALPEKSLPKENVSQKMAPIKKEVISKRKPPGLREIPGSKELTSSKRPEAAEPLVLKKSHKKASSSEKAPQKTSKPEGSGPRRPSSRERLSADEVSSRIEESARLHEQDETAPTKRRSSKTSEAAVAEKETAEALKHWRTEEEKHWMEMEQRAIVNDERDTIEYWREVEAKHVEEEKLRGQPEAVLPPGSQEIHRLELEKILEQRRIAEEERSQQRSQQKDASQRRKSQTGIQDTDKKRRKQTKNQQRKQRREAQAALARLQNRSLSPVKRRREATGTVSPPPIHEVNDSTQADEPSSAVQDEDTVDLSKLDMSVSEVQNPNDTENDMPNTLQESSPMVQRNSSLASPAGPSTPGVPAPACRTCRLRHRACDRVRPGCGECSKREVGCVWDRDAEVSLQKPKTSSHKKKTKCAMPEPKACRTCNTKHRRCDRKGPICGECSKNGRECVWSSDTATPRAPAPAEASGSAEEQERDEVPELVEPQRDEMPGYVQQTGLDEEPDHEETPEERDMRQLASQLTTTQDEPASSTLLALASPPTRNSQRLSQTVMPVLPPTREEPITQAPENGYTSSQALILALSKANIIARMTSNKASRPASTASGDSDRDDDLQEEIQPEPASLVKRRVMVAVEVRPAKLFGRSDSEDREAGEDTSFEADVGEAAEVQTESVIKDEGMEDEMIEPARPASPAIVENDDEDMNEDVEDASDSSRDDTEDLILHDISGYDSADAEDEDLRDSEEDDETDASVRRHERSRGFVDDLASENSDEEEEEIEDHSSDQETKSEEEREEEKVDAPAVNWGESSDDEEDDGIHKIAAPAPDSGSLANINAKPVVTAQTQTPESDDAATQNADVQSSGQDVDINTKMVVPADEAEQEVESSAQIDDAQQGSNDTLERGNLAMEAKPQSPISASFGPDKHHSLRESLVNAIRQDDDSEQAIDAVLSQPPRSASPELGDANLLALSPSIFTHNFQSPSAKEGEGKHVLEVAESVYEDDDPVQYPELGDLLDRVSEEEPEDDGMDVDNDSMPSVGDRPIRGPLIADEKSLETPTETPDVQMIDDDDDSDFSEDDLAGAQDFPQSKPLEEYPDDVKFEPSQLEAMSPPERLTQLQLPDLPPGMVASQYPAVFYPPLPTMGNVLSSPGEGDINAMTALDPTQTSPATSTSDDASAVTAPEYSQDSPEPKPDAAPLEEPHKADSEPTHIAEHVNKNDGPEVSGEDASRQVAKEHEAVPSQKVANRDDWAATVEQSRLRSGRVNQETSQQDSQHSTQSFCESQGLVRCSIKKSVNEREKPQKKKKKRNGKSQTVPTVKKTQNSDVIVANTQLPADSPDIERLRSQSSGQAIVLETQSSAVPESPLSLPNSAVPKPDSGPAYNECSTRGVDFTWERDDGARQQTPLKPPILDSQHGSDDAISPEKVAAIQPPSTPSKRKTGKASSFFDTPSPKKPRPAAGTVSCIDVPPLSNSVFGLIQEELAHKPFQLLVAVVFLNKTRGKYAIPVFREVIEAYPTPQALEKAHPATLSEIIKPLGLFNQRAATLVNLARVWNLHPPTKGRRVMTPKYPSLESHKGIGPLEVLGDDDEREGALEIGHLPGIGAYAFDSWRIFCRDELRGVATDWNSGGASNQDFLPEWKRVLPNDKELRAYLRWMWLKEGVKWNPVTGEKDIASGELLAKAELGGLDWDEVDAM